MRILLALTLPCFVLTSLAANEQAASVKPIVPVTKVAPKAKVFEKSTRKKPLVLKSEKDAAKYFTKPALKKLQAKVDFEKQIVLVFAWKGSGQDKMTFDVAESDPEQVTFQYRPGRTRDLRPHVKVYALRSNVKWSVQGKTVK